MFDVGLTKHFNLVVESLNIQLLEHKTDPGRGLLVERQEDFHIEVLYLGQTLRDPMGYSSQLHCYGVYEVGQVDTEMMVDEWGEADTSVLGIPPISLMVDISNKVGVCSNFVPGLVVLLLNY